MEKLKVNGHLVEVDYPAELELYMDRLERVRVRGEKVQACSPFRNEKNPSWAVNLDNGSWVDSGANEEQERKGSFLTLLAFFRGETYEETADYLLEKYSHILDDTETLHLDLKLQLDAQEAFTLTEDKYKDVIRKPSQYLLNRGIKVKTQKFFETGIGEAGDSIVLPWHDVTGKIVNIKYRSIKGKEFWFIKGGQPIKQNVFGLFAVKKFGYKEVWAVESEIDCLYLWSNGIPSIAFGGASMNDVQKNLILNAGIESFVVATDNDVVGQRFGNMLHDEFAGVFIMKKIIFPSNVKDVNEINPESLKKCKESLINITKSFLKF